MTATTAPRRAPAPPEPALGSRRPLAGTGTLLRFNLRRDRIRIPVWIAALLLGTVASAASFAGSYKTAAERQQIAETLNSPAALAMSGPEHYLTDYNYGSMLSHQIISFAGVLVGLMSVLMVVRHTRAEEESGRAELVRSAVVGRHAHLTAALLLAVIANAVLGLLLAVWLGGMGIEGITWGGSLLYGATHFAMGVVFAGVAAVTVQITAHPRGASGMAFAAIGLAFGLRAAGDVGREELSWLSPIGWAQRTYPYVDNTWWPLLLALALAVALAAAGFHLSTRRDVGSGLRAGRPGRRTATPALTHPLGFAVRLHRGMLAGFLAGVVALGVAYGSILGDAEDMIENVQEVEEMIAEIGGATVAESFASVIMLLIAIVAAVHVVMATLRPRSEESAGRAEPLLATGLSRTRWAGSHLAVSLAGGTLVLAASGAGFGIAGAASTGDSALIAKLTGAALAYAPALWVCAGVGVALFGWLPQATAGAWAVPVYAFVVGYLGAALGLPEWMNNLSPFGHVPQLPAADLSWPPLLILTAVAAGLIVFGLAGFRRRDLDTK